MIPVFRENKIVKPVRVKSLPITLYILGILTFKAFFSSSPKLRLYKNALESHQLPAQSYLILYYMRVVVRHAKNITGPDVLNQLHHRASDAILRQQ